MSEEVNGLLPKEFRDRKSTVIKPGDELLIEFVAKFRERPGGRRVAVNGMSGQEVIVSDEGRLKETGEKCWAKYRVKWSGACLIAERGECSDFQTVMQAELYDDKGRRAHAPAGFHYMNEFFDSTAYKIIVR